MPLHVFFRFSKFKTGFWLGILDFGVVTSIFNMNKIEDGKFPQNQRKNEFHNLSHNFYKKAPQNPL